jgi:hypothetical protein
MTALFKQLPILLKKGYDPFWNHHLAAKDDVLTYSAMVLGQNNDKVAFKQTNETQNNWHSKILSTIIKNIYTHKTTIDLAVKISGIQQKTYFRRIYNEENQIKF